MAFQQANLYNYVIVSALTPSLVHVHMTQGETRSAEPMSMVRLPTEQLTRSFHRSRSILFILSHFTRGFLKHDNRTSHFTRGFWNTTGQLDTLHAVTRHTEVYGTLQSHVMLHTEFLETRQVTFHTIVPGTPQPQRRA